MSLIIDVLAWITWILMPVCWWLILKNTTTINPEVYRKVDLKINDDGDHLAIWS